MPSNPVTGGEPQIPEGGPQEGRKPYHDPDPLGSVPGAPRKMSKLMPQVIVICLIFLAIIIGFISCALGQ